MISDVFSFFPFTLGARLEFPAFYLALFGVTTYILLLMRDTYGRHVDGMVATTYEIGSPQIAPSMRLRIGTIPMPDQYYAIAALRRGLAGAADTLIAMATSAGYLKPHPLVPGTFQIASNAVTGSLLMEAFINKLAALHVGPGIREVSGEEVRTASREAVEGYKATIATLLRDSGLLRSAEARSRISSALWLAGSIFLFIGIIRILISLGSGQSFVLIAVECLAAAVVFHQIIKKTTHSLLRDPYLAWLDKSTESLRDDVHRGKKTQPEDIGLSVAMGGAAVI